MAMLAGSNGIGHVTADAAYDADPLRVFLVDDLGAIARVTANPSRTGKPATDRPLHEERHQLECFSNKIKRFRRAVSLGEPPLPSGRSRLDLVL